MKTAKVQIKQQTITPTQLCRLMALTQNEYNIFRSRSKLPDVNGLHIFPDAVRIMTRALIDHASSTDKLLKQARLENTEMATRKIELDIATKESELLDASAALDVYANTIRQVALFLDKMPDTLERVGVLDAAGVIRCRNECDILRQELFDRLEQGMVKQTKKVLEKQVSGEGSHRVDGKLKKVKEKAKVMKKTSAKASAKTTTKKSKATS